jgi:hypothetical protein
LRHEAKSHPRVELLHTLAKRDWMNTVSEFLTEVPETNHVSSECNFSDVLYLQSIGACNVISHFEYFVHLH